MSEFINEIWSIFALGLLNIQCFSPIETLTGVGLHYVSINVVFMPASRHDTSLSTGTVSSPVHRAANHCMKPGQRRSSVDALNNKTIHGGFVLFYRTRYAVRRLKLPSFVLQIHGESVLVPGSSVNFIYLFINHKKITTYRNNVQIYTQDKGFIRAKAMHWQAWLVMQTIHI